jgi:signal transduction histidine kinase
MTTRHRHPRKSFRICRRWWQVTDGDGFSHFARMARARAHTCMRAKCKNPSPPVTRHPSVTGRGHGR